LNLAFINLNPLSYFKRLWDTQV